MRTIPCHECGQAVPAHQALIRSIRFQQIGYHRDCLEAIASREEESPAPGLSVSTAA